MKYHDHTVYSILSNGKFAYPASGWNDTVLNPAAIIRSWIVRMFAVDGGWKGKV